MDEALQLVDKWLRVVTDRSLMSSEEVTDLLLDVRVALTRKPADPVDEPVLEPEPIPVG